LAFEQTRNCEPLEVTEDEMGVEAEELVDDLLEAFVQMRREVSTLPPRMREPAQHDRYSILDDVIRASPVQDLRTRLVERARSDGGWALAAWIESLFHRYDD
jgi:hypothetical protein